MGDYDPTLEDGEEVDLGKDYDIYGYEISRVCNP